jgi:transcriptional regulator with XRE-family HTH domain
MEQDQIEQGARLSKLVKALNFNQSTFARSLDMTQPNISRMLSGESKISAEALSRIIHTYKQVNLHWLLTGEGEMFLAPAHDVGSQVKETPDPYQAAKAKGKLEDLEDRIEQLEAAVRKLVKDLGK